MADNKVDMQIGLGVEYDATGFSAVNADIDRLQQKLDSVKMPAPAPAAAAPQGGAEAAAEAAQAQQQLAEATQSATEATEQQATATAQVDEQLAKEASTLWELAEAKYGSAAADAKEQKAMQLATKSRNELIKTLKRLQGELQAAAEAQDVEKYREVEQEIAETRQAFEKQNQVLELNNIQMGQQAQNGMLVANTLAGLTNGLRDGSASAGDFASGILAISSAMKAGLGPIGWLMLAVQGLQAAWDAFSSIDKEEEEAQKAREDGMRRLQEITDKARVALEDYNRTKLSEQALLKVLGYYGSINAQLERQIKNIEKATKAELARLAVTQDEQEHKRTLKRAQLGRQLAAGTISQEEYDRRVYDMNEGAAKQALDDEVTAAEVEHKAAEEEYQHGLRAFRDAQGKASALQRKQLKFGSRFTVEKLTIMQEEYEALSKEWDEAWEAEKEAAREGASKEEKKAARDRRIAIGRERGRVSKQIKGAYDEVYGEGKSKSSGKGAGELVKEMVHTRQDLDEQAKAAWAATDKILKKGLALEQRRDATEEALNAAKDKRDREFGQMADARKSAEEDRALQQKLEERQRVAEEVATLETEELKRRRKEVLRRAKAARKAGDAEGENVLRETAALYKDEFVGRRRAEANKAAVAAAREKAEAAGPSQDKRTDEVLREAQQLANRIAKGEALDGRSAEQLIGLLKQAKETKDKKDDAFLEQLIQLALQQTELTSYLQGELRKLKRKTEKLTNRNFD